MSESVETMRVFAVFESCWKFWEFFLRVFFSRGFRVFVSSESFWELCEFWEFFGVLSFSFRSFESFLGVLGVFQEF